MAEALIIIGAAALDWGLAWLVWRGLVRLLGDRVSKRVSAVMPSVSLSRIRSADPSTLLGGGCWSPAVERVDGGVVELWM